jgi:hypothetical protein
MPSNPLLPGDDHGPAPISGMPAQAQGAPSMQELVDGLHKTTYVNAKMKELLLQKVPPSKKDIFDLASDLVDHGALTSQRIAGELASMPQNADMLKPWLFTHWLTTENQIDQILQMIQTKGALQRRAVAMPEPLRGQAQPSAFQGASSMSLSPAAMPAPPANRLLPNGG